MNYCPNCGNAIEKDTKFCPNCGTNILQEKPQKPAQSRLEKGVIKSLKDLSQNTVQKKVKENLSNNLSDLKIPKENKRIPKATPKGNAHGLKAILTYIIFSVIVYFLGKDNDVAIGINIFSFFVLLIYFIRNKKEKRINWLAIIILILQSLLIISFVMDMSSVLFVNAITSIATLSLLGMLMSIFYLIFAGNKR